MTPHLSGAGAFACQLAEAEDEVRVLLRSYRHLGPGQDDNFSLFASDTVVNLWERLTAAISGMAIGIVSVFMIVGGIVIMNIMLAVVTERTQEIGIRKSLGARDILNQYLVESSVLAGSGGFAGVCIAWLVAVAVRSFTSVPMALPWSSVVIGVGLAAVVGLFFGIYPAQRAAKLDPIEALRVESRVLRDGSAVIKQQWMPGRRQPTRWPQQKQKEGEAQGSPSDPHVGGGRNLRSAAP